MRISRSKWAKAALVVIAVAIAGSVIAGRVLLPEANPPLRHEGWVLSERAQPILERACFDCHSNATRWPWYAYVPPVSLFIVMDVAEGREHVNFSAWDSRPPDRQAKDMQKALEEIREGEMPLKMYLWAHADARVSEADLALLTEDVAARYGEAFTRPPPEGEEHEH